MDTPSSGAPVIIVGAPIVCRIPLNFGSSSPVDTNTPIELSDVINNDEFKIQIADPINLILSQKQKDHRYTIGGVISIVLSLTCFAMIAVSTAAIGIPGLLGLFVPLWIGFFVLGGILFMCGGSKHQKKVLEELDSKVAELNSMYSSRGISFKVGNDRLTPGVTTVLTICYKPSIPHGMSGVQQMPLGGDIPSYPTSDSVEPTYVIA